MARLLLKPGSEVLTMLSTSESVAHVVLEHSECAEVFQRHRIDFCCKGELSVESAARERGVELERLMRELQQAIQARREDRSPSVKGLPTAALVEYIVEKHHGYLRKVLPFLRPLATKVARVHGDHNRKLRALDEAVSELSEALLEHLDDEERSLFPSLRAVDRDEESLSRELAAMRDEHLAVAALLERIRAATDDFTLPEWACNSYRTLFGELEVLERDVFTHVHLENHVLAPRFAKRTTQPAARFDLASEAAELRATPAWSGSGHSAKTLVRNDEARVVLIAIRAGARILEHKTEHSIMVQALEGHVEIHTPEGTVDLPPLGMVFLEAGVKHDVVARDDSTVLLTIKWNNPAR